MNHIGYKTLETATANTIDRVLEYGEKEKAGIWQATELFKDHNMRVLRNESFSVIIPSCKPCLFTTGADTKWAEEHFQERISGNPTNPGESYKRWPYNTFKPENDPYTDGEKFSHTYQERFWPKMANVEDKGYYALEGIRYQVGDLNDVIKQLKENPLTRQAYLPIFFPEDTGAVHKQRVPCTLGYYFWIKDGRLWCNYIIRSCDILRHFRNDIYLAARLMQYVGNQVMGKSYRLGKLEFICFNLHVFENDFYVLKKKEQKIRNGLL